MANPNLAAMATMKGDSDMVSLSTTNMTVIVNNPASSGKVFQIDFLSIANDNGSALSNVTVKIFSQDDLGGTGFCICYLVPVPAGATLIVFDGPFYLKEDRSDRKSVV